KRALGRQPGVEQGLRQRWDGVHDLTIGEPAPIVPAIAVGDHQGVGGLFRPLGNGVDDGARIGAERFAGPDAHRSIGPRFGMGRHRPHANRTNGCDLIVHADLPNSIMLYNITNSEASGGPGAKRAISGPTPAGWTAE